MDPDSHGEPRRIHQSCHRRGEIFGQVWSSLQISEAGGEHVVEGTAEKVAQGVDTLGEW